MCTDDPPPSPTRAGELVSARIQALDARCQALTGPHQDPGVLASSRTELAPQGSSCVSTKMALSRTRPPRQAMTSRIAVSSIWRRRGASTCPMARPRRSAGGPRSHCASHQNPSSEWSRERCDRASAFSSQADREATSATLAALNETARPWHGQRARRWRREGAALDARQAVVGPNASSPARAEHGNQLHRESE
jgi:hypothetical protein